MASIPVDFGPRLLALESVVRCNSADLTRCLAELKLHLASDHTGIGVFRFLCRVIRIAQQTHLNRKNSASKPRASHELHPAIINIGFSTSNSASKPRFVEREQPRFPVHYLSRNSSARIGQNDKRRSSDAHIASTASGLRRGEAATALFWNQPCELL